ncbi:MAG: hypothetical protein LBL43_05010 [Treponema sp.]|jgi:uncharacterized protein (DUF3084 family)|nr:hypothetical protein [Treponema sp.]
MAEAGRRGSEIERFYESLVRSEKDDLDCRIERATVRYKGMSEGYAKAENKYQGWLPLKNEQIQQALDQFSVKERQFKQILGELSVKNEQIRQAQGQLSVKDEQIRQLEGDVRRLHGG